MSSRGRPSLARLSLFSATWWTAALIGWPLLAIAVTRIVASPLDGTGTAMGMTMLLLLVLELRPLVLGRGHDPQGVVMSTAVVLAVLFLWGEWPAIVGVSVATLCSSVRARKTPWKSLFNIAQYNVSVAAAAVVMSLAGHHPSIDHPLGSVRGPDLLWMFGASVAYFVVNDVLVSAALAFTDSFRAMLMDDIVHYTATTFSVLAISPLVVVVAQSSWALLPLILVPLLMVYRMAQMSLEREHEANHDVLTGLPNRKNLQISLAEVLPAAARDGGSLGLLLIDLDRFKEVNDTLGHQVGDQLLVHFASRLTSSVRPDDLVSRLGGDEFAVIIPDATEAQARRVAERIQASLAEPVALNGLVLEIEASIGLAMYPEHAQDAEDLLRMADVAMYAAKESLAGVATYDAQFDQNSADRLPMIGLLRRSLDDNTLELHYQPKISLLDSSLMGVEALLRWRHPERGFVPPDEFIPLAERSGIMPLITERVISLALRQMAEWRSWGLEVPVAVNISPTDLTGGQLIRLVRQGLDELGLPAEMLRLEITERVVSQDTPHLAEILRDIEELGVTLSLDDFGTGYSSLLRLKSLPVHELKIDRGFVSGMSGDPAARGIVRAIVDLAHTLAMPAIAEGVETEDEAQALRELGCDGAQGWYFARPMTAALTTEWMRDRITALR